MNPFIDAWQGALAAQQQAVFGFGLLGPHAPSGRQPDVLAAQTDHELIRDTITAAMVAAGVVPVHAKPDYPALYPVDTTTQALALAAHLEDACAVAWRVLYLASAVDSSAATKAGLPGAPARRTEAQHGLTAAAIAATRWRKIAGIVPASRPFPGI